MRRLALVLVVLSFASGCVDLREQLEAPPAPEYARVVPWSVSGCDFVIAILPVDASALGSRVPEGFRVLSVTEIPDFPVPAEPRGDGNIGIEAFRCASATDDTGNATLADVTYGSIFSFVEPPEEMRENTTYTFVKWDTIVADPTLRQNLANEGTTALDGNATVTLTDFQPLGMRLEATATFANAEFLFSGIGSPQGSPSGTGLNFIEYAPANGEKFVEWRADINATSLVSGVGQIELPAESWVNAVVGANTAQAYYIAGIGELAGNISFPYRE